jgi:hypothetical protein
MAIGKRSLKKMFPNLAKELEEGKTKISIDSIENELPLDQNASLDRLRSYDPTVVDFIRRCDQEEQAESIIDFMEKRGEIDKEYAEKLRQQLGKDGIRSFGPKKEPNYYFRAGGIC